MKRHLILVAAAFLSQPLAAALPVGSQAPDFRTTGALAGKPFNLHLKDQLKHGPLVLYFYPKAFTQGCTLEAKAFADAFGETPEEKTLIKQIYTATKTGYEAEAAKKGWKNNIAGGITFFTVAAMTVYHDAPEPSDEAVTNYYKAVNLALDEMPEFATVSNKDKQSFNNMMIGFGGLLLAGYLEGKQNNDAATLAGYKKIADELVRMVLKTDPANLRVDNGQIVLR